MIIFSCTGFQQGDLFSEIHDGLHHDMNNIQKQLRHCLGRLCDKSLDDIFINLEQKSRGFVPGSSCARGCGEWWRFPRAPSRLSRCGYKYPDLLLGMCFHVYNPPSFLTNTIKPHSLIGLTFSQASPDFFPSPFFHLPVLSFPPRE